MYSSQKLKDSFIKQHDEAEILISWIQLVFTVLLFTIYMLAPKAHQGDILFEPVPIILGVYLPFVLLRVYWAYKHLLNDAALTLYCVIDVSMITALIISFHYQYDAAATVSLKAPTFLYLLMFMSIRILRFDMKYIIMMGVFSVGSIIGLTVFAYFDSSVEVTRNFVDYASSTKLLIGVEVEKIIAITFITTILSVSVWRNQNLLRTSVRDAEAKRDMSKFFSPEVLTNIINSDEKITPGSGKLRSAAVLMMDLRGFTKMSLKLDPTATMSLLADYQKRMVKVILDHGGSIDKFMGDGILAHFGAAKQTTTFAADCLRAMSALSIEMEKWNEEREDAGVKKLDYGISAAVGKVIFGAVGDASRLEFTTIGDAVNLAAKLEKHTKEVGVASLTTKKAFETALKQGFLFDGGVPKELQKSCVHGMDHTLDLVVLKEYPTTESDEFTKIDPSLEEQESNQFPQIVKNVP